MSKHTHTTYRLADLGFLSYKKSVAHSNFDFVCRVSRTLSISNTTCSRDQWRLILPNQVAPWIPIVQMSSSVFWLVRRQWIGSRCKSWLAMAARVLQSSTAHKPRHFDMRCSHHPKVIQIPVWGDVEYLSVECWWMLSVGCWMLNVESVECWMLRVLSVQCWECWELGVEWYWVLSVVCWVSAECWFQERSECSVCGVF